MEKASQRKGNKCDSETGSNRSIEHSCVLNTSNGVTCKCSSTVKNEGQIMKIRTSLQHTCNVMNSICVKFVILAVYYITRGNGVENNSHVGLK